AGDPRGRAGRIAALGRGRVRRTRARLRRGRRAARRHRAAVGASQGDPLPHVSSIRIFFVGGLTSYRALFGWLSPWILIPTFCIAPLFQILLFAYIGRTTHLESDKFYVVGNALQYASLPCLFAMAQTIDGERFQKTLSVILATPAPRLPLFLGRSLPVIANGILVSAFAFTAGGILLGIHVPVGALGS